MSHSIRAKARANRLKGCRVTVRLLHQFRNSTVSTGGQEATQQDKTLLSPCHRLAPPGFESASVCDCVCLCVCVCDIVMRVGTQPNGHLTGAVALSWCVAAALAALQVNSPCCEVFLCPCVLGDVAPDASPCAQIVCMFGAFGQARTGRKQESGGKFN